MFIIDGYDRKANACSPWTSCSSSNSFSNFGTKFFIQQMLLRNNFFLIDFIPLFILFNLLANLVCSSSASFKDKYPSFISLKNQ